MPNNNAKLRFNGAYAYLLDEVTSSGMIGIRNSWGASWGKVGRAYMTFADFDKLFKHGGEALAAVEVEHAK